MCGHCTRLDLECTFRKRPLRSQRSSTLDSGYPQNHPESIDGRLPPEEIAVQSPPVGLVDFSLARDRVSEPLNISREQQSPTQAFAADGSLRPSFPATPRFPRPAPTNGVLNSDFVRPSRAYPRNPCEPLYGRQTRVAAEENYDFFSFDRTFDPPYCYSLKADSQIKSRPHA